MALPELTTITLPLFRERDDRPDDVLYAETRRKRNKALNAGIAEGNFLHTIDVLEDSKLIPAAQAELARRFVGETIDPRLHHGIDPQAIAFMGIVGILIEASQQASEVQT